ncbi:putative E3 ubiquitin-protein ligase HTD2, partial [Rhizopus stolonifer]
MFKVYTICICTQVDTEHLDLNLIKSLKREAELLNEWTKLVEKLARVFGHLDLINQSFLKKHSLCPIDKTQTKEAFELLQECPSLIMMTVKEHAKRTLNGLVRNKKEPIALSQMNILLILFQCPFDDFDVCFMSDICDMLASLNEQDQDQFFHYLIEPCYPYTTEQQQFKAILDIFQQFVSKRLALSGHPNSDTALIDATKCIAILYRLNEHKKYVSYTEFYNEAVNDQLEIKEDFPNFKDKKGFSFCDYPFMLNPAVKADVLKVESVFQMRHELQDAFFRALFQGVNSPYLVLEI